ncbi:hypothetical protein L7F22_047849 [Adiantum nelumboides]|nr:hypothetical protein [Adiantum nelumboides]
MTKKASKSRRNSRTRSTTSELHTHISPSSIVNQKDTPQRTRSKSLKTSTPLGIQTKVRFPKSILAPQSCRHNLLPLDINGDTSIKAIKKTSRRTLTWTEEDMAKALAAREEGLSLHKCSLQFGISKSTIASWEEGRTCKKKRGPATMLTSSEEEALLQWIFQKCESGHGISVIDVKLKVAEMCQTRHTIFTNGIPGKSWWLSFRKRHPELVFRVSEGLEQTRATRFRPEIVKTLHDNLEKLYNVNNYPSSNIWNADETGFQGSRDKGIKVLARKGSKSVYGITCDSREWMTVLCCVNAAGHSIPSYYIFKGSRITSNYIENCEQGAAMAMQRKAWMTGELFQAWLNHFKHSIAQDMGFGQRHLLILDGHGSHVSLEVVASAHDAGIDIVTLPSHTSHKLQPLDVSVFKSLKGNFRKERAIWQLKTASSQASKSELASIASKAIALSLTEENIKAGFKATGIWPHNPAAVRFESMPCNRIAIVDENLLHDGAESQVPNTPLSKGMEELPTEDDLTSSQCIEIPSKEGEAVHALKSMANFTQDTTLRFEATAVGELFLNLTGQELMNSLDPINQDTDPIGNRPAAYQTSQHAKIQERQHEGNQATMHRTSQHSQNQRQHDENPATVDQINHACYPQVQSSDEQSRIVNLLRVPVTEVCVRSAPREALVDYTNSLIITSSQYVESMRAKNAKKEEITKAKEQKRLDKDKKRLQSLAEKDERRQRKEETTSAKLSKREWELQQQKFEKRMRSILWEKGSLVGLYFRPLHVDQPFHVLARKARLQKRRTSRRLASIPFLV